MAGGVSFKSFYMTADSETEVRRFVLPQEGLSFVSLTDKLSTFYPGLADGSLHLGWKDADDDFIIMSSDDELKIYLSEQGQQGSLYRIWVVPLGFQSRNRNSSTEVHEGIICDNCNQSVIGFRYKCLICPDFDLCCACESKGSHPEHFMLRIPKSMKMGGKFAHKMGKKFEKHARRCGFRRCSIPELYSDINQIIPDVLATLGLDPNPETSPDEPAEGQGTPGMSGNQQNSSACPQKPQQEPQHHRKPHHGPRHPRQSREPRQPLQFDFTPFQHQASNFVYNLESMLHKFLDPTGGEHSNREQNANNDEPMETASSASVPQQQSPMTAGPMNQPSGNSSPPSASTSQVEVNPTSQVPQKDVPIPLPAPDSCRDSSPLCSEWTLLPPTANVSMPHSSGTVNHSPSHEDSQNASQSNQSSQPSENSPKLGQFTGYPKLPSNKTLDERVEESLQIMLKMGFNNEGEWLRQILQANDGDIRLVFEHLMPHRNDKNK